MKTIMFCTLAIMFLATIIFIQGCTIFEMANATEGIQSYVDAKERSDRLEMDRQRLQVESMLSALQAQLELQRQQLLMQQRSQQYPGVGGWHWVSKVLESGKYVILEDNSLWEISPVDRINSMLFWLVMQNITVVENKRGIYPYKLINYDSKDAVEAKYLGSSK